MKVSKSSALKLLFVIAAVSIYTFVGFADSAPVSGPQKSSADSGSSAAEPGSDKDAGRRSLGCLDCHNGIEDMHRGVISLGCIDCHGGKADVRAQGMAKGSAQYQEAKKNAHVQPRFPEEWKTSANPERTYTLLL